MFRGLALKNMHELQLPAEWVQRWAGLIPAGGEVLDLACGMGRHGRYLASLGYGVCAVDRDTEALSSLTGVTGVRVKVADLEGSPWPFGGQCFAGIIVTNYLHRPLFPHLIDALAPGGVLIYETFAVGNERFGKPSNPDFLLYPGELLESVRGRLRVIAYEDLQVNVPKAAMIQRICAIAPLRGA